MPNSPKTPAIAVRLSPQTRDELDEFADDRNISRSDAVRHAVEDGLTAEVSRSHHSCTHSGYGMTCEEFDALAEKAGGACQLCGAVPRKLWIDHDHELGWFAVRGLVCPKCNAHMRRIDTGERVMDEATAAFMDNAWHYNERPGLAERSHQRQLAEWAARKPRPPRRGIAGERVMTQHSFECEEALWHKAQRAAGHRKESMSAVIRRALTEYVDANYVNQAVKVRPHHDPPATD